MELSIHAIDIDVPASLHAKIERRIRFALARFGRSIEHVGCSISDLNGPRGGLDKLVRLEVKPSSGRMVVIEQVDSTVVRAVDLAVDRAARSTARELQRSREPRREAR